MPETVDAALPPALLRQIQALHAGPERSYHTWSHPRALLGLLEEVRSQVDDPLAVECAILLHDAVYDATRSDNERRSAALARELLAGVVPEATLARAVRMIEATELHQVPAGATASEVGDICIFLDLDLSILGAPEAAFDAYEAGVRHEYRHLPENAFRAGRAGVLQRFVARQRLFMSEWGVRRFESAARANLWRSLRRLRGEGGFA